MKFLASCFVVLLLLAEFTAAQNWSLNYSTYVGTAGEVARLAVNGQGDVCITSRFQNYPTVMHLLTKLKSDGSLIYTSEIPGTDTLPDPGRGMPVAMDSSGNCFVAGLGVITPTAGAFQTAPASGQYVMKFSTTGSVVYATYLTGSGQDIPLGLAVDSAGDTYLTGSTNSNDFPTLNAYQSLFGGGTSDAFVAVLNPSASALVYSTYLGGSDQESGAAIAVDNAGNAYLTGTTRSTNFPTVAPFQSSLLGTQDTFVTKLTSAGAPTYSTYLSGSVGSQGFGIAADGFGDAYVTGSAGSGFPLVNPIQSTTSGESAFVSEFNSSGSALVYSTYFGDNNPGASIAVDASGQTYFTGGSTAGIFGFPTVPTVSPVASYQDDVFLGVISPNGTSIVFSTYLGSIDVGCQNPPCDHETLSASIGIDSAKNIYVAGATSSLFPILNALNGTYIPFMGYQQLFPSYALKIAPTTGPVLAFPEAVPMPSTHVGTLSQVAPLLLANTSSSGTVNITSIVTTGDFSQTNNCGSAIPAATNCQLMVTFSPTATGPRAGAVTITDDAPGSPQVINLTGTGLGALVPQVSLTPSSLTFAAQIVGTTSPAQVETLKNTGLATLNITKISASGDFAESNDCGGSVKAGNSCQISVTFTPTTTGTRNGTLSVTDDAAGSPQTVPLSGIGSEFQLAASAPSPATVTAGGSATSKVTVTVAQNFTSAVTLSCSKIMLNGSAATTMPPTCSFNPASLPNGSGSSTLTISTTGRSALLAPAWTRRSGLFYAIWLPIGGVALIGSTFGSRKKKLLVILAVCLMLSGLFFLAACGGSSGNGGGGGGGGGTPAGTYTITVTGSAGSSAINTNITLVVQ
jgi:hypothetical protein